MDEAREMLAEHKAAAAYWSRPPQPGKTRWWQSPTVLRHQNRLICGDPLDGAWAGLNARLKRDNPAGWDRGISIACGNGVKEMGLIEAGLVRHFDLFELAEARVAAGRALAVQKGLQDNVTYHARDPFGLDVGSYDLVYWNNALHHMLDVNAAVAWSRDCLHPGGWFVMDDYVGPNRMQWSDAELAAAQGARMMFPARYLTHPLAPNTRIPLRPGKPTIEHMIASDPTEAADSEAILPAVRRFFPNADIMLTGGVIYHLALSDVIANFDEQGDRPLLEALLALDAAIAAPGLSHYAVALARKD